MTFFSLESLGRKAGETLSRFPLSIAAAFAGTVVMIMVSHHGHVEPQPHHLYKLAMSCYLVMLSSISVSLYAERFTLSSLKKNISFAVVVLLGILYFYSLPEKVDTITGLRFTLFTIGLHFLVAFVPFMVRAEMNGLWQFNKYVFIRILTSALYSGVLFLGLALALVAIDQLFKANIHDKYYFDLWIVIVGIFNTWFFLSGVPQNLASLEDETSYPKGLKIFTVYVLLPLVCIYLAILYVYGGKILYTAEWPVGWVAYLVIAFSIFGILSFLLIYPLRDNESQRWVRSYSRLFYFLLAPLIVLLFVAIFKRVNMYGITEERYFVILLSCWLTFISVYLIITGGNNIRTIPVSLCIIAFLSSFGPWGAFTVSRNSQMKELTILLDSNHVLKNNMVDTTATHDVLSKDYERIENIVRYIDNVHGYKTLQPLFAQELDSVIPPEGVKREPEWRSNSDFIVDLMKLNKIYAPGDTTEISSLFFKSKANEMMISAGYDFVSGFTLNSYSISDTTKFILKGDTIYLAYSEKDRRINILYKSMDRLMIELGNTLDTLYKSADSGTSRAVKIYGEHILPPDFAVESDSKDWGAKVVFSELRISRKSGSTLLDYATAMLFVKLNVDNVDKENEVGEKKQ